MSDTQIRMEDMSVDNGSKIIVALDVSVEQSEKLIDKLAPYVGGFKVGFRQIAAGAAPHLLKKIRESGSQGFLDIKFKDIPKTVADAVAELEQFGVWMFNLHCDGGVEMMEAAVNAARKINPSPLVLGVTVLPSLSYEDLDQMGQLPYDPKSYERSQAEKDDMVRRHVAAITLLAKHAGLDGVVGSPKETAELRSWLGDNKLIVTPAVRPTGAKADDQKRVGTARQAILDGSSYLVVGRPICEAENPLSAVLALNTEVEQALADKQKGTTV